MSACQCFIQSRAFVEFHLVQFRLLQQDTRCLAAVSPHSINFKCDPRCAANRQRRMTSGFSHGFIMEHCAADAIQTKGDFKIGVCPTNTPYETITVVDARSCKEICYRSPPMAEDPIPERVAPPCCTICKYKRNNRRKRDRCPAALKHAPANPSVHASPDC